MQHEYEIRGELSDVGREFLRFTCTSSLMIYYIIHTCRLVLHSLSDIVCMLTMTNYNALR